jgi:hypothetical protein
MTILLTLSRFRQPVSARPATRHRHRNSKRPRRGGCPGRLTLPIGAQSFPMTIPEHAVSSGEGPGRCSVTDARDYSRKTACRSSVAVHRVQGPPPHCGQSLQSVMPIMIREPIATTIGQTNGNSSSTQMTTARTRRVFFVCAKRQPATPIGRLRLAPSSGGLTLQHEAISGYRPFGCSPGSR